MARIVGFTSVGILAAMIVWTILGLGTLLDSIPLSYDPTGTPTTYGPPIALVFAEFGALALCVLFLNLERFKGPLTAGARITEANRPRVMAIMKDTFAWFGAFVALLTTINTLTIIEAASHGNIVHRLPGSNLVYIVPIVILGVHLWRVRKLV